MLAVAPGRTHPDCGPLVSGSDARAATAGRAAVPAAAASRWGCARAPRAPGGCGCTACTAASGRGERAVPPARRGTTPAITARPLRSSSVRWRRSSRLCRSSSCLRPLPRSPSRGDACLELGHLVRPGARRAARRRPRSSEFSSSHTRDDRGARAVEPVRAWRRTRLGAPPGRGRWPAPGRGSRLPSAACGGARPRSAGRRPRRRARRAMAASAMGRNSMRTHRDAMVTSSGGTWSASTRNTVLAGGSSIVFSSRAAPSASSRWNSCEDHHLAAALHGRERRGADDRRSTCSLADASRRRARTSRTSGCSPASASRAARCVGVVAAGEQQRGERAGGLVLRGAGRPDEQIGVHRVGGGTRRAARQHACWPTTPSHTDRVYSANITDAQPIAARRRGSRRATSSMSADAVDDHPALGLGGGHRAEARRARAAWNVVAPPARTGRARGRACAARARSAGRRRAAAPVRATGRRSPTR